MCVINPVNIKIMGAISNHYGDVQIWVEKVIDSCETYNQTRSARMLVWNFEKQKLVPFCAKKSRLGNIGAKNAPSAFN